MLSPQQLMDLWQGNIATMREESRGESSDTADISNILLGLGELADTCCGFSWKFAQLLSASRFGFFRKLRHIQAHLCRANLKFSQVACGNQTWLVGKISMASSMDFPIETFISTWTFHMFLQDGAPKIAKLPYKWFYGRYNYSIHGRFTGL